MPFHIKAKNSQTGEVSLKRPAHAHPDHDVPGHPNYHNRAHVDSLAQARKLSKIYADKLNADNNTTVWVPVDPPEYYIDPRFSPHPPGNIPPAPAHY